MILGDILPGAEFQMKVANTADQRRARRYIPLFKFNGYNVLFYLNNNILSLSYFTWGCGYWEVVLTRRKFDILVFNRLLTKILIKEERISKDVEQFVKYLNHNEETLKLIKHIK